MAIDAIRPEAEKASTDTIPEPTPEMFPTMGDQGGLPVNSAAQPPTPGGPPKPMSPPIKPPVPPPISLPQGFGQR